MQRRTRTLALTLAATAMATTAWAQAVGTPPTVPVPFTYGTITAVDPATGTIMLTPKPDAGQTVKVSGSTQILVQRETKLSDLKLGDIVQVRGIPMEISASLITGGSSDAVAAAGAGPITRPVARPDGGWMGGTAFASAGGIITNLNPLTITVAQGITLTVKAAPDLKIIQTLTEKMSDLKVGDRVLAGGLPDANGVINASRLRVNMSDPGGAPLPQQVPLSDGPQERAMPPSRRQNLPVYRQPPQSVTPALDQGNDSG